MGLEIARPLCRRRAAWLMLLPLACCATLSSQTADRATPAGVSGSVTNSLTGDPIQRAHVVLNGMAVSELDMSPRTYGVTFRIKWRTSVNII